MFEGISQNPLEMEPETPKSPEEMKQEQFEEKETPLVVFEKVSINLENFNPQNKEEEFCKTGISENLRDIRLLFEEEEAPDDKENKTDMPSNSLIAYRGLEQTLNDYPLGEDLGIEELKTSLGEKIKEDGGFDVEEIEDMDMVLEANKQDVEKIINEIGELDNPSQKKLDECQVAVENYLSAQKEITQKQAELKKDSGKFYEQYSKKIMDSFGKVGEKLDEKAMKSKLLGIIGKKGISSKVSRATAIGLVALVGGLVLLSPETGEASETENIETYEKTPDSGGEVEKLVDTAEIEERLEKSEQRVIEYIKELGFFSKIGLINEIKNKAEDIKELLLENNTEVYDSASKKLTKILHMYTDKLNEIKNEHPELYEEKTLKIASLIDTIKTTSLTELKSKLG